MALIKCPQCGHGISDKAVRCPKCSCVLNKATGAGQACEEASPRPADASAVTPDDEQRGNNALLWAAIICLIVCGGGGFYYYQSVKAQQQTKQLRLQHEKDSLNAVIREAARRDSLRQDSIQRIEKLKADVCEAYVRKFNELRNNADDIYRDSFRYFLHDVTGDGIPELWVSTGGCMACLEFLGFTYDDGIKEILRTQGGHSKYFKGRDYIIQCWARYWGQWWHKYSYDGNRMTTTVLLEEEYPPTDDDDEINSHENKYPTKEEECFFSYDTDIIRKAFGQE